MVALVAALTLVFNQRRSQALSLTAQVVADQVTVGAQFGGVVVSQYVAEGDSRRRRATDLFTVVVPRTVGTAGEVVAAGPRCANAAYVVDPKKPTVTYRALATGRAHRCRGTEGGFVQSGSALATITAVGSEYAMPSSGSRRATTGGSRAAPASTCSCPTTAASRATVRAVSVDDRGRPGPDRGDHRQRRPARHGADAGSSMPGTPVSATLSLRDDGPLAGPTDAMVDFLRKIGVR